MEFCYAKTKDAPAVTALWQQVFGDEPEFIRQCLSFFAGEGQVYIALQKAQVVAQLLAVPCKVGACKGVYFYGLATAPVARNRGVMSDLMLFVEKRETEKSAMFSVLIPANESLYTYYTKRGYTQVLSLHNIHKSIPVKAAIKSMQGDIDAAEFSELRKKFSSTPYVDFSVDRYAMLLQDLYSQGFKTYQTENAYALYRSQNGTVFIPEILALSDKAAEELLMNLAAKTGISSMQLTVAANTLFAGEGTERKAGLLKPLRQEYPYFHPYLRFGFDEMQGDTV